MRSSKEIVREILKVRGIAESDFENFLHPSLSNLAKSEELPGIVQAAEVILASIRAHEKIVVFGDYDCDGVCATAILTKTLLVLGALVEPFLPKRLTEGYGMSEASVTRMLKEFPDVRLVVTVDNGINSIGPIAALREKGISVVITDHHLPGDVLPAAEAIVNPKVDAPEYLQNLCGAGVAFLLANRLICAARECGLYTGPSVAGSLLVLAGLATVTDIMPLLGQNRILVAEALARFRSLAPMGLRALHSRAARTGYDQMTSRDFSFLLGPRINAAGRLQSGMEALELILSEDREITRELARIVDEYNMERKTIEQKMTEEALAQVVAGATAQVIDLPNGHPGVAGIVAARVLERIGEVGPVCVLAGGHGSARSPEGINIRDAFVACADHLSTYGGHAAAGGFTVRPGETDAFRKALCAYCAALPSAGDVRKKSGEEPDIWLDLDEVTLDLAESLRQLEPFGEANPEPVIGLRGVSLSDLRLLGADGRHLALSVQPNGLRGVWWGHGDQLETLRAAHEQPHTVTGCLYVSDYGERHVEMRFASIAR